MTNDILPVCPPLPIVASDRRVADLLTLWLSELATATRDTYLAGLRDFARFIGAAEEIEAVSKLFAASKRQA